MGFHLRKSVNLGLFKLNLSNSGVGISTGIKGLRFGIDGKGRSYVSGGKGALRYRKYIKNEQPNEDINTEENVIIDSGKAIDPISFKSKCVRFSIGYLIGLIPFMALLMADKSYSFSKILFHYTYFWLLFTPLILNVFINRKNTLGIILLNILLGWTLICPICQIISSLIWKSKNK